MKLKEILKTEEVTEVIGVFKSLTAIKNSIQLIVCIVLFPLIWLVYSYNENQNFINNLKETIKMTNFVTLHAAATCMILLIIKVLIILVFGFKWNTDKDNFIIVITDLCRLLISLIIIAICYGIHDFCF